MNIQITAKITSCIFISLKQTSCTGWLQLFWKRGHLATPAVQNKPTHCTVHMYKCLFIMGFWSYLEAGSHLTSPVSIGWFAFSVTEHLQAFFPLNRKGEYLAIVSGKWLQIYWENWKLAKRNKKFCEGYWGRKVNGICPLPQEGAHPTKDGAPLCPVWIYIPVIKKNSIVNHFIHRQRCDFITWQKYLI